MTSKAQQQKDKATILKLTKAWSKAIILSGITRGETAIHENRTYTQLQAREMMKKWLK